MARLRRGKKFTLKFVGENIGRTHSALSQIENGKNNPDRATLIALAKFLNDDFGEDWLKEYLTGNHLPPSKQEIIEETPIEEIFTLKFGGKNTRRTKEEMIKLRKLLDREIEKRAERENDE